jgi:hypothetical protein
MDWDSNLPGVKNLFASPSQNRKDGEVPAKEGNTSDSEDETSSEDGEDGETKGSRSASSDIDSEDQEQQEDGTEEGKEPEGDKKNKKDETGSDQTPPALRKAAGYADGQTDQEKGAESAAPAPDGAPAFEKAKLFLEKSVRKIRTR